MRRLAAIALTGLAAGAGAQIALVEPEPGCGSRALLDQGTLRGDGVFLAVVTEGCGEGSGVAPGESPEGLAMPDHRALRSAGASNPAS